MSGHIPVARLLRFKNADRLAERLLAAGLLRPPA